MRMSNRVIIRTAVALAMAALFAASAGATTLIREGVDKLTTGHEQVLLGKVVDLHSYWNADQSFLYTDVRVRPSQSLKGRATGNADVTLTLMGGTVGETTVLIVGGPEFVPGSEYVLFLGRGDLAGTKKNVLTIPSLSQGVFEVVSLGGVRRAVSQAWNQPLLPDDDGEGTPPGGPEGLELDALMSQVRNLAGDR
jgi:hypothetical protein